MHYTVEALLLGKENVLEYFEHAKDKWKELFETDKDAPVEKWSESISAQIPSFEEECGGRLMAPEIMAWSAMGSLYSIQFGWRDAERARARKLIEAIDKGGASASIKDAFKHAAASYELDSTGLESSGPEAA